MTEEIQNKPETEQLTVYDKVHRSAWTRRTAGLFTGATMGATFGTIIGTVAAMLPYALGAMGVAGAAAVAFPSVVTIASTAALFAGAGALLRYGCRCQCRGCSCGYRRKRKKRNSYGIG